MDLLTAMRTFVEVVQAGSMNAAAQRLNVTSALVGQRIAALEDHLQTRLLNRTTRRSSLTNFGERYLEQCRDILELVALSENTANDQHYRPQGRLRIAAPVSFGIGALVPVLKDFAAQAPAVEIDLVLSDTNEDLTAGGFDVAFRIGALEDSTLLQTALAPYRMRLCAAPAYLQARGAPQAPADLDRFQAVLFSKTGRKPWRLSKGEDTEVWEPKATFSVNSARRCALRPVPAWGLPCCPRCWPNRISPRAR